MPYVRIEIAEGWPAADRRALLQAVDRALVAGLGLAPARAFTRLYEYARENALVPAKHGERFVLVEITLFPGRSIDVKRALYEALVREAEALGVARCDVSVVLHEVAKTDWGFGGVPGSELKAG